MVRRGLVVLAFVIAGSFGGALLASPSAQAQSECDRRGMILTIKPWYYGLTEGSGQNCQVVSPSEYGGNSAEDGTRLFFTRIILTVVEGLLQVAGFVTLAFIIYGGFIFMTSSGAPERAVKGRKTVTNAAIGLFIALAAVALVNLIAGVVGV